MNIDSWQKDNLDLLLTAVGKPVTAAELQTLTWLAGWDDLTVKNVISILEKVKRAD